MLNKNRMGLLKKAKQNQKHFGALQMANKNKGPYQSAVKELVSPKADIKLEPRALVRTNQQGLISRCGLMNW